MPILKIVKTRQKSLFLQFSQREIDEVSHRAICSQVYDCLFNSTHLAKKYFEFRWCVQSQQIFRSTTRPGFFVGFDFRMQILYTQLKQTHTQQTEGTRYTQTTTKQYRMHSYVFVIM